MCKNWFKNSHPFGKKCQKAAGGDFFLTHTVGVEHLLMPAQLTGTHWAMTGMIWCLALTVWDVCLKLSCFQSTSTYSALEASHFMRYINSQVTYLLTYLLTRLFTALRTLTKPVTDLCVSAESIHTGADRHQSRQTNLWLWERWQICRLVSVVHCMWSDCCPQGHYLPCQSHISQTHQLTTTMPHL